MNIVLKKFADIDILDRFFDTLKQDYQEFEKWFIKKQADEAKAFVMESEMGLEAFLYLKRENEPMDDVIPKLPQQERLKIGTFKVNPHGTRLGERFIKKIFDYCVSLSIKEVYVTVFEKHEYLIKLFKKYGFIQQAKKITANGEELVLVKNFSEYSNEVIKDYPIFKINKVNKYLLAIYPAFHTRLFPDSILNNENFDVIKDVSHTNSIHKIYVCTMNVSPLRPKDIICIYRTSDNKGPAHYRSVLTSICVVEEVRRKDSFENFESFLAYSQPYSVFSEDELREQYNGKNVFVIKMTYNAALSKRVNRKYLIEGIGINENLRWSFINLTDDQFCNILKSGGVNESLIIDKAGIC